MLKPRAEKPTGDGKTKRAPREIASQFVKRKAKTEAVLGGEKQQKFDKLANSGAKKDAKYKKAEKEAKAELRQKFNDAFTAIGVKKKGKYSKKEQSENRKKAIEALTAKGRGALGRDGRSQLKDIAQGGNKYGTAEGERLFGKKGYAQVIRAATRTDKGGGKVRKTNKRAYQVVQKVQEISTDPKTGKQVIRVIEKGARGVKFFDASKPLPKGVKDAVRQYEAQKKGSWKGQSAPALGEDGYKGARSKGKQPKGKKAQAKDYKKNKPAPKAPTKKGETKAPAKKGETAEKPKKAKKTEGAPAKKEEKPKVKLTAEARRLVDAAQARKQQQAKPKPAATPAPAPAPQRKAPERRTTADTTLQPEVKKIAPVKLKSSGVANPPTKGNTTQARKKVVQTNIENHGILDAKVKKEGIQSLTKEDRQTYSFLQRTLGDNKAELKNTKWKK